MILLFEIARRLVKAKKPSDEKEAFDVLPIGSAIARLINLLETGNYNFEDVFFEGRPFHCFSGKPVVRRMAIEAINEATADKETVTKGQLLKELQEMFCYDHRLKEISSQKEDQLVKTSKELENMSLNEALSDAEIYTAFDFCLQGLHTDKSLQCFRAKAVETLDVVTFVLICASNVKQIIVDRWNIQ